MSELRLTAVLLLSVTLGCSAGTGRRPGGEPGDGGGVRLDGSGGSADGGAAGDRDGGTAGDTDGGGDVDAGSDRPTCGPTEICGDGLDNDCDGTADTACSCAPGATQSCYDGPPGSAGVGTCTRGTQTCTGMPGTEFGVWSPCEGDTAPIDEICGDELDNDCDGTVDDGCGCPPGMTRTCYTGPADTSGIGECRPGMQTCLMMGSTSDWGPCEGEALPRPEVCDGTDRDCDGTANTGCTCVVGTSRACYSGTPGTAGVGICREGLETCVAGAGGVGAMWGPCTGEVLPEPDACDGIDHLCTGMPGATCPCIIGASRACYGGPAGTRTVGVCRDGTQRCIASGGSAAWDVTCVGDTRPGIEACANAMDDDCDGATDEGCGGMIMCPGDLTVPAGDPIVLTTTGTGLVGAYTWTIVSAPTGGAATAVWAPAPPTAATETFTPFIVGVYQIRVSAMDTTGVVRSCMFNVTALPHGLRVQLTWDGSGDLDLHLHNAVAGPWFSTNDTYYANTMSTWGGVLDFDNTSGFGPENVTVDTPVIGTAYTIGTHNYSLGSGRVATIQIFFGSTMTTVPTMTFTSRALAGSAAGNCTANDFWRVARVTFTSATACTITPINTYNPSSGACTAL